MSRRRNEFRSFELGVRAIVAFLFLICLAAGGLLHFAQILIGLVELLLIVAVVAAVGWLGVTIGVRAYRNRRTTSIVFQTPAPSFAPSEKGPLSDLVWPDEKGTTLRLPGEEPPIVSNPVLVETPARAPTSVPAPVLGAQSWTETEILQKIHQLDWYQFEKFNTALMKAEGWDATHFHSQYGDGGKDVVARRNGQTLYIQCKALSSPVPEKIVRELLGSLSIARVASGAIHAAGPFSKSAQVLAVTVGIRLIDDYTLAARARKSIPSDQLRIVLSELPHLCFHCESEMELRTGNFRPHWRCKRCNGKIYCRKVTRNQRLAQSVGR